MIFKTKTKYINAVYYNGTEESEQELKELIKDFDSKEQERLLGETNRLFLVSKFIDEEMEGLYVWRINKNLQYMKKKEFDKQYEKGDKENDK